jgi:hypothetical protein
MAKEIKLSGREGAVIRAVGFGLGVTGTELVERLHMAEDELTDVLNALLGSGYLETASMRERIETSEMNEETFEVNPSYAGDLKAVLRRY